MTALTIWRWDDFDEYDDNNGEGYEPHEQGGPFRFTFRWALSGNHISNQLCFPTRYPCPLVRAADPEVEEERFFFETGMFEDKGCPQVEIDELTD